MADHHPESASPAQSVELEETVDRATRQDRAVIAGRYFVLDEIGEGTSGRVLRADDLVLRRCVAVKIPHTGADQDSAEKFLHEARAAAAVRHPGVVTVHDFGQEPDGLCYLVEDLIEGTSLTSVIENDSLDLSQAVRLLADVAEAVHAAHECDLVHRDLKPANILIDRSGRPFVTDFGLALTADRRSGETNRVSGTPIYMSPEQTLGESDRLDACSDIWSLGVILYELLTGRRPFPATAIPILFEQIQSQPVPAPSAMNPRVPPELDEICLRCLEKRPADRISNALYLASHLHSLADSISVGTPSVGRSIDKPRRDPVLAASVAVAALTFLGFGVFSLPHNGSGSDRAQSTLSPEVAGGTEPVRTSDRLSGIPTEMRDGRRLSTHRPNDVRNAHSSAERLRQNALESGSRSGPE